MTALWNERKCDATNYAEGNCWITPTSMGYGRAAFKHKKLWSGMAIRRRRQKSMRRSYPGLAVRAS